jgi:hypothetical protein
MYIVYYAYCIALIMINTLSVEKIPVVRRLVISWPVKSMA